MKKKFTIKLMEADKLNSNGRVYTKEDLENAVKTIEDKEIPGATYDESKDPRLENKDEIKFTHVLSNPRLEDDEVKADIEILDNEERKKLILLLNNSTLQSVRIIREL